MTPPTPKFKLIAKDSFYFGRYEYCLNFRMEEANVLRNLGHADIDDTIAKRRIWREMAEQRWAKIQQNVVASGWRTSWKKIDETTVANLHDMADTLLKSNDDYKLVVTIDKGCVYTNSLSLIDLLDLKDYLSWKSYSQVKIDRPANTIRLKHSKYAHRSYIRHIKLKQDEKENLCNFFQNNHDTIRISPGFLRWFDHPFDRTQDWFFIDHDSTHWLTMLSLIRPGLIRKTVQIIPAK